MQQIDTLIQHALVVCMDQKGTILEDGALAIHGSSIVAVGPSQEIAKRFSAAETIDASQKLVLPGLINSHVHCGDLLFRGLIPDSKLEDWLEKLWIAEAEYVTPENMDLAVRAALLEMVRSGTTTALDMFWFPEVFAGIAAEFPFRLITGPVYLTLDGNKQTAERIKEARRFLQTYQDHDLIRTCILPHGTYTVNPDDLQETRELAKEYGALLHIHLSETRDEVATVEERYGKRPPEHLDSLGMLSPATILAHCVHLNENEIELLADRGAVVVHCPLSNMKLASGLAPVDRMLSAGIPVLLGTDGPVSSNDLDLWKAMRFAATLHKATSGDPAVLPAEQVVRMVTSRAAQALGMGDLTGSLEAGKRADLILIDLNRPHLTPIYDVYSLLVYAVGRGDIEQVMINGTTVFRDGAFPGIEEEALLSDVNRLGNNIAEFMATREGTD